MPLAQSSPSEDYNRQLSRVIQENYPSATSLDEFYKQSKTTSLLVLKDGQLIYEQYAGGYDKDELHCMNSVSKSIISLLIGIAMEEGHIDSIQEPFTNYVTELKGYPLDGITIEQLLDMESGIDFQEAYYSPFGNLAKFYYGTNIRKYLRKLDTNGPPGNFDYVSANTDFLGWVLEEAVWQSVPRYAAEKLWIPLRMEYPASWSLDSEKNEVPKYSYGLNARSIDLLKIGQLCLDEGVFDGKAIVSNEWIQTIFRMDSLDKGHPTYKNHWWKEVQYKDGRGDQTEIVLSTYTYKNKEGVEIKGRVLDTGNFYAAGFLGQFIYVSPGQQTVVVRTGKKQGKVNWVEILRAIAYQEI